MHTQNYWHTATIIYTYNYTNTNKKIEKKKHRNNTIYAGTQIQKAHKYMKLKQEHHKYRSEQQ